MSRSIVDLSSFVSFELYIRFDRIYICKTHHDFYFWMRDLWLPQLQFKRNDIINIRTKQSNKLENVNCFDWRREQCHSCTDCLQIEQTTQTLFFHIMTQEFSFKKQNFEKFWFCLNWNFSRTQNFCWKRTTILKFDVIKRVHEMDLSIVMYLSLWDFHEFFVRQLVLSPGLDWKDSTNFEHQKILQESQIVRWRVPSWVHSFCTKTLPI